VETSCPLGHWLILGLMRRRGSDFRVSNFEFRFSVLCVSNFEFRISSFGFRLLQFRFSIFEFLTSFFRIPYSLFFLERRGKAPSVATGTLPEITDSHQARICASRGRSEVMGWRTGRIEFNLNDLPGRVDHNTFLLTYFADRASYVCSSLTSSATP